MQRKIVILNGPPRCGKDELCKEIKRKDSYDNIEWIALAGPLKAANKELFSLTNEEFYNYENKLKDVPQELFFGKTWRDMNIMLPEEHLKPNFGKGCMAHFAAKKILNVPPNKMILISDLGFKEELDILVDFFGAESIHVIRIKREGCNFDNDSRDYVKITNKDVREHFLDNNTNLINYLKNGVGIVANLWRNIDLKTEPFKIKYKTKKGK